MQQIAWHFLFFIRKESSVIVRNKENIAIQFERNGLKNKYKIYYMASIRTYFAYVIEGTFSGVTGRSRK